MAGLVRYIAGRLVTIALASVALSWIVFLLMHALPGNPFSGSERMTIARQEILMQRAHLNDPYPLQYLHWLQTYFTGDLSSQLMKDAWTSVRLGLFAVAIMLPLGVWLGVISASRQGTRADHLARFMASVSYGVPNFVWAMALFFLVTPVMYRFTGGALFVPVGWGEPIQWVPPAIALALPQAGYIARVVRASMLDALGQDYVRTARAKGVDEPKVLTRHALRNALVPLASVMGPIAIATLVGSIVIERAFDVPGLGSDLINGIFYREYFVVTGVFTYYTVLAGLAMLAVDLAYVYLDPKIRY